MKYIVQGRWSEIYRNSLLNALPWKFMPTSDTLCVAGFSTRARAETIVKYMHSFGKQAVMRVE